jgi:hypothetical protein
MRTPETSSIALLRRFTFPPYLLNIRGYDAYKQKALAAKSLLLVDDIGYYSGYNHNF